MKTKIISLLGILAFVALVSCNKDEDTNSDDGSQIIINTDDADAVTEAIEISGASVIEGTPPATTTNTELQIIAPFLGKIEVASGNDLSLPIEGDVTDIDGIYLQVEGASSYLDIPLSSTVNNRISTEDSVVVVVISIPEVFETGSFDIAYCVYQNNADQQLVGNVVTTQIEIVEQTDIATTEELTPYYGKWYLKEILGDDEETLCDGTPFKDIDYIEELTIEIFENNTWALTEKSYYVNSYLSSNGDCENEIEYYSGIDRGTYFYSDDKISVVFVDTYYDYISTNDSILVTDTSTMTIELVSNELIVTSDIEDPSYQLIFSKSEIVLTPNELPEIDNSTSVGIQIDTVGLQLQGEGTTIYNYTRTSDSQSCSFDFSSVTDYLYLELITENGTVTGGNYYLDVHTENVNRLGNDCTMASFTDYVSGAILISGTKLFFETQIATDDLPLANVMYEFEADISYGVNSFSLENTQVTHGSDFITPFTYDLTIL